MNYFGRRTFLQGHRTPRPTVHLAVLVPSVIAVLVTLAFFRWQADNSISVDISNQVGLYPSSYSHQRVFRSAAACTDLPPCSRIGRDILAKNGSVVDAALAALFCNGVLDMESLGPTGGFIMIIYNRKSRTAEALVSRETAPAAATTDMFTLNYNLSKHGALASGVPGALRGYWEAHKRFGRLRWAELVLPALRMCREGYKMSRHQYMALNDRPDIIPLDRNLRKWFVDRATGKFKPVGALIRPRRMCETLAVIAREGGDALNHGSLTKTYVEDLRSMGGIITEEDLRNYKPEWRKPVSVQLHDDILYTSPPPASGVLLAFILKILSGFNMTADSISTPSKMTTTMHRIVEAFKFAFAKRTKLGDPNFVDMRKLLGKLLSRHYTDTVRSKIVDYRTFNEATHYGAKFYNQEDHGTAHLSFISPNGDAVAVTSTINLYFGAAVTSERTGLILSSGMDDFSSPGAPNAYKVHPAPINFIEPGKRATSSFTPSIIVDKNGDVKMVVGASGGPKILTSVAWVIIQHLWLGRTIKEAVDSSRLHHQLYPMEIDYEYGVTTQLLKSLQKLGHKTIEKDEVVAGVVCALTKQGGYIYGNADFRKGGEVDGI